MSDKSPQDEVPKKRTVSEDSSSKSGVFTSRFHSGHGPCERGCFGHGTSGRRSSESRRASAEWRKMDGAGSG